MQTEQGDKKLEKLTLVQQARYLAQNDHMIDQYFTETGKLLNALADKIEELEDNLDRAGEQLAGEDI